MKVLRVIVLYTVKMLIAILLVKNGKKKVNNALNFYYVIEESFPMKYDFGSTVLAAILITADFGIAVGIWFQEYLLISGISGILIQVIYLSNMVRNYGKVNSQNCGCYLINSPKEVNVKSLVASFGLLYAFIVIVTV